MDRPKTMERLKKRAEFLAVAGGARASRRGFVLQKRDRPDEEGGLPRFGFTVTKKMGNSPERNRIRRRLREAVRLAAADQAGPADYVLIGRRAALSQPFGEILRDLASGLGALKRGGSAKETRRRGMIADADRDMSEATGAAAEIRPALPGASELSPERSDP